MWRGWPSLERLTKKFKGVGVYFCSQFPDDVPNDILGQLGNRIQHALRAYTPRDQKAVKTAAETFVPNPRLDVAKTLLQLGVGEALVSTLQEKGIPLPVERTLICPPRCRIGAITPEERAAVMDRSPVGSRYDTPVNRESAYEILKERALRRDMGKPEAERSKAGRGAEDRGSFGDVLFGTRRRQGLVEAMVKQAARTVGSQIGRAIIRNVLGTILGGSRRR